MKLEKAWPQLREGKKIRNGHWDPAMYIVLQEGYPDGIPINENTAKSTGIREGTVMVFRPYIMMHCVDGSFVPYVATQSDLLTEYWQVLMPGVSRIDADEQISAVVVGYNFDDPK